MIKRILASILMFSAMTAPAVLLLVLQLSTTMVRADQLSDWYMQQLFAPTSAQLQMESNSGRVYIYQGLRDTDVLRALDEQFERVEYMMFTGTVITNGSGMVQKDPETGEELVESDGC